MHFFFGFERIRQKNAVDWEEIGTGFAESWEHCETICLDWKRKRIYWKQNCEGYEKTQAWVQRDLGTCTGWTE